MAGPLQLFQIERQTTQIVQCLFEDDDVVDLCQLDEELETDGPVYNEQHFDPVTVAESLKKVAESLTKDAEFNAALKELKCALVEEAMEEAFSFGVDTCLKAQTFQNATDLAPEIQVIKVCFAFGLFVKQSCPELKTKAQRAVTALLNTRVATWVNQRGGWATGAKENRHEVINGAVCIIPWNGTWKVIWRQGAIPG